MMTMVIGFKANVLTMRWQYSAWSTIPIVIVPGRLSGNEGERMMTMMIDFKANVPHCYCPRSFEWKWRRTDDENDDWL